MIKIVYLIDTPKNFNKIRIGDVLNIEYDILGKYINQILLNREL